MKKRFACMFFTFFLMLSGCGPDVDLILQNEAEEETHADEEEKAPEEDRTEVIYVYVCGAVNHPGVYGVPDQSRICELVDLAGGMTEDADADGVNLARPVSDGEMIRIPTEEEAAAGMGSAGLSGGTGSAGPLGAKVNINTAGAQELMTLSGIGESKAAAIVAYREEHGAFQSIEEIMEVSGIGESTFERIKESIMI